MRKMFRALATIAIATVHTLSNAAIDLSGTGINLPFDQFRAGMSRAEVEDVLRASKSDLAPKSSESKSASQNCDAPPHSFAVVNGLLPFTQADFCYVNGKLVNLYIYPYLLNGAPIGSGITDEKLSPIKNKLTRVLGEINREVEPVDGYKVIIWETSGFGIGLARRTSNNDAWIKIFPPAK